MPIDLTGLSMRRAEPVPLDFGSTVEPPTGGRRTHVDRLGSRWAFAFETKPVHLEPDGRRWASRLAKAQRQGGLLRIKQPGLIIGAVGSPVIATNTAAGRVIPISGLTGNFAIKDGYWLSLIVDGQRYLDQVDGQVIANATGEAEVRLQNLIRVPLTAGVVVELSAPKIEGKLENLQGGEWTVEQVTSWTFTVSEEA